MGIRGESEFSRAFPFHTKCDMDQSQLLLLHKDRMAISELSIQAFLAVIVMKCRKVGDALEIDAKVTVDGGKEILGTDSAFHHVFASAVSKRDA